MGTPRRPCQQQCRSSRLKLAYFRGAQTRLPLFCFSRPNVALRPRVLGSAMLDRRRFVALAGSTFFAHGSAHGTAPVPVGVTVDYENSGRPIAPDFMGLSYESALL